MERIRNLATRKQSYERIDRDEGEVPETRPLTLGDDDYEDGEGEVREPKDEEPFEWMIYGVFFLLGVAMLWAW